MKRRGLAEEHVALEAGSLRLAAQRSAQASAGGSGLVHSGLTEAHLKLQPKVVGYREKGLGESVAVLLEKRVAETTEVERTRSQQTKRVARTARSGGCNPSAVRRYEVGLLEAAGAVAAQRAAQRKASWTSEAVTRWLVGWGMEMLWLRHLPQASLDVMSVVLNRSLGYRSNSTHYHPYEAEEGQQEKQ